MLEFAKLQPDCCLARHGEIKTVNQYYRRASDERLHAHRRLADDR